MPVLDRPTETSLSPAAYCQQISDLMGWLPVGARRHLHGRYPTTDTVVQLWRAGLVDPRRTPEVIARLADLHRATAEMLDELANQRN